jgi:hypothetical protein
MDAGRGGCGCELGEVVFSSESRLTCDSACRDGRPAGRGRNEGDRRRGARCAAAVGGWLGFAVRRFPTCCVG